MLPLLSWWSFPDSNKASGGLDDDNETSTKKNTFWRLDRWTLVTARESVPIGQHETRELFKSGIDDVAARFLTIEPFKKKPGPVIKPKLTLNHCFNSKNLTFAPRDHSLCGVFQRLNKFREFQDSQCSWFGMPQGVPPMANSHNRRWKGARRQDVDDVNSKTTSKDMRIKKIVYPF